MVTIEPNRYTTPKSEWCADAIGNVAIQNVSGMWGWQLFYRGEGILAVELSGFLLTGAYISPNCNLPEFEAYMGRLHGIVARSDKKVILVGNINSKVIVAGSSYTNRCCDSLVEFMMTAGLFCLNNNTPMYEARGLRSVLELTILGNKWDRSRCSWRVV